MVILDMSLPSWAVGFPNTVVFLASTSHLQLIGLSCSEQNELGLS